MEKFQNVINRKSSDKFNNFQILRVHIKKMKPTPKSVQNGGEIMLSYI
jgi:hypothetical protein